MKFRNFSIMIRVLIETYWNVKFVPRKCASNRWKVLIETYWNVKGIGKEYYDSHAKVLIETYWNVKSSRLATGALKFSINRNILECKVRCGCVVGDRGTGINRNILECKDFWSASQFASRPGINRNILECKGLLREN